MHPIINFTMTYNDITNRTQIVFALKDKRSQYKSYLLTGNYIYSCNNRYIVGKIYSHILI